MSRELAFYCEDGQCTWRWDPNDFPVDEVTIRVRHRSGDVEVREVPNTGSLVLPETEEVEEIVTTGRGGKGRKDRWREPQG